MRSEKLSDSEIQRWARARAYAQRQGCSVYAAMEYGDWLLAEIRAGRIALPAQHTPWFTTWRNLAG